MDDLTTPPHPYPTPAPTQAPPTPPSALKVLYNEHIVKEWYASWVVWLSAAALLLPDALQWGLDHFVLMDSISIDNATKNTIRVVIVALIPLARAIRQKSLERSSRELQVKADAETATVKTP